MNYMMIKQLYHRLCNENPKKSIFALEEREYFVSYSIVV